MDNQKLRKQRIINRIINSSSVYSYEYLNQFELKYLENLQELLMINLILTLKFKSRKNK